MSADLDMLAFGAMLSLARAVMTIVIHGARFGGPAIRGNREDYPALTGVAARVVRAHTSFHEALLPFAIVVVAAALAHISNDRTVAAAQVFVASRIAHASFYIGGVRILRSVSFYLGLGSTIVIATQLMR